MQKKDDKVGNKTAYKEEGKGKKKRVSERPEIDSQILACVHARNAKKMFNFIRLIGKKRPFYRNSHFQPLLF